MIVGIKILSLQSIILIIGKYMTREEAMKRFMASKKKKEESLAALKNKVAAAYEDSTGLSAKYITTL